MKWEKGNSVTVKHFYKVIRILDLVGLFRLHDVANNGHVGISHLGSLLGLLQLLLGLAELGQVEGSDLLGLLNLLLVGLDLLLQLVGEVGHAVLVLLVLVLSKLQLLDLTVRPLEGLDRLHGLGLSRSKFSLKFSDSQLQLAESILALLHGATLSIRQST